MNSLLRDPLIRVHMAEGGMVRLSLPSLYAALADDRVVGYPALRPHQRHAWHAFLAQLAAIAVDRAEGREVPRSPDAWEAALRNLTPGYGDDEPWHLVIDDAGLPAFLQPPAPDGLATYSRVVDTPDDLDLLVTAKNHEVKQSVALAGSPEDWIFALVNLQTMSGFLGSGNYGIARMNGGFSSRSCLGLAPADGGLGAHLFVDVDRMLADREGLLDRMAPYFRPQDGLALLWLEPWDGTTALDLRDLDPYFIEVCRRVRLVHDGGGMAARTAGTQTARIDAKAAKGNLGDFWTPVHAIDKKALSLSGGGFDYKRLSSLLFDNGAFDPPAAMRADPGRQCAWRVVARAIASGQGKTEGYFERTNIRFAPRIARLLFGGKGRDMLAEVARHQIDEIDAVGRALKSAVAAAASGGKPPAEISKEERARATPFVRRFEAVADAWFFEALQERYLARNDDEGKACRGVFVERLTGAARDLLSEAVGALPCPTIRRHRARAKALHAFERELRRAGSGPLADLPEIVRQHGNAS